MRRRPGRSPAGEARSRRPARRLAGECSPLHRARRGRARAGGRAPSSTRLGVEVHGDSGRGATRRAFTLHRRERRADDHGARREAAAPGRGHTSRGASSPAWTRSTSSAATRRAPRARCAVCSSRPRASSRRSRRGGRARRPRRQRRGRGRALPSRRPRAAAAARRRDLGRARRLGAAWRAVPAGPVPGTDRGRLRLRRLLRRRADVRARPRPRRRRRGGARRPLRRAALTGRGVHAAAIEFS